MEELTLSQIKDGIVKRVEEIEKAKKDVAEKERDLNLFIKGYIGLDPNATVEGLIACVEKVVSLVQKEIKA